jgi:hypothetical protein
MNLVSSPISINNGWLKIVSSKEVRPNEPA